jgi:Tol biopolymer transport system component
MNRIPLLAATAALLFAACVEQPRTPLAPEEAQLSGGRRPVAPGSILPGSVAFISNRTTGYLELFVMNPGGDNVRQLTFSDQDEERENMYVEWIQNRPAWSPDGRKLLFTRRAWDLNTTPGTLIHDVHILDLDEPTPRPRRLMSNPQPSGNGAWSPDGRKIAYCSFNAGPAEIWIFDLDTGLTAPTGSGAACWPHWSPDGGQIAFHTIDTGRNQIAVLDVASGAVRHLSSHDPNNPAQDVFPRWSPDGRWLAFHSNRASDEGGARYSSIFVVPADGSGAPRNVTPIPAGTLVGAGWVNNLPSWSNNGKHIYFHGRRPGSGTISQIFRTTLDGTEVVQLTTPPGGAIQPDVRPVTRP